MRGAGRSGATCPVNGKRCSITPNTNSRISPHRNSGIERSRIETRSVSGSSTVPRTRNIRSPPPMPKIAAITIAATASWMVAGNVVATSDPESRRNWMERPKSPCRASVSQITYCSGSGRSRPISCRLASISSSVAVGGSDIAAGSTGSARSTQNNSTDTASSIGTAVRRRRAISLPTIPIISPRRPISRGSHHRDVSSTAMFAPTSSRSHIRCRPNFSCGRPSARSAAAGSSRRLRRRSG